MRPLKKLLFSFVFLFYHFQCLTDSFVPVETIENIVTCWEGDEGIQLHHENGVKTEQLVPPHEYVPWVTFNDVSYCNEKIRQNVRRGCFLSIIKTFYQITWYNLFYRNILKMIHQCTAKMTCADAFVKITLVMFPNAKEIFQTFAFLAKIINQKLFCIFYSKFRKNYF